MWVADARERRDRPARGAVQPVGRVAEHLGRPTPVVEVELAFRVLGHLLVHPQDFALDHPLERALLLGVRRRDVGHGTLLNSGNLVPTCGIGQRQDIDCINRENTMIKPGLTLHRLELFLAVLDEGGVGRAAKACNISQPAVSEHLQGLGAYFGVRLLERRGRTVRPTAAAQLLEPYARQVVGLLQHAGQAAADLRGLRSGSLTIGASTTPGTYLVPAALGPAMELGSTEASRDAVAAGLGVALVSRHAVRARDPRVVAVRLAGGRWTRDLLVVHRAGTPLGAAAAKFREFLVDQRRGRGGWSVRGSLGLQP